MDPILLSIVVMVLVFLVVNAPYPKRKPIVHYMVMKAYRQRTDSSLVRFVSFTGDKRSGMRECGRELQDELGPAWEVFPEITTREFFCLRLSYLQKEDDKWNALLR